jgi:hypothetical protein
MSYISDFKSSPFSLFGVNGGVTSSDASLATLVGVKFHSADSRVFTIIQNGGVALTAGKLVQGPVSIGANHTGLACATAAIGATQITVTLGGTAVTANQYAGGFAVVSAGTGIGQTLKILSHPAQTSTSGTVVLTLEDALSVATSVSDSKVSLTLNQYGSPNGATFATSGCVISPTTATGPTIGVTVYPIPATTATVLSYGFIQTSGPVAVLNDSATAIGLDVMPSSSVAGAVVTYAVATRNRIGTATVAGENTKCQIINLQLL